MSVTLHTRNHDRHIAGLKYIYPVISRRAGGLSIGINFNPNNACNWRCVYCQVPNLSAGNAPELDVALLAKELRVFLDYVLHGDFFQHYALENAQQIIKDLAISGNGEPTSLKNFSQAVTLIGDIASEFRLFPISKYVLISNGSLLHQGQVQAGLSALATFQGELWFKLDSATENGRKLINNTGQNQQKLLSNLKIATELCCTKLQTCMLNYQWAWSDAEKQAYLQLLITLQQLNIPVQKIMLYSIARPSLQPEANDIQKTASADLHNFAREIAALGYAVSVND